jgi:hypothetical protein
VKIALLVEGVSDAKTLSILVKKIRGESVGVISRVIGQGNLFKDRKVCAYIQDLMSEHPDISKIIACVDSECTPEAQTQEQVKKIEKTIKAQIDRHYHFSYVIVVHALEGWLLADPDAIGNYLGPKTTVKIPNSATLDCRPKETLKIIFKKAGKDFLNTVADPRLAERVDCDKMVKRNKSFAHFYDCIKSL